jgi:hypothetical protein
VQGILADGSTRNITLWLCEKCGQYGLMSIYGPHCTGCQNEQRFGSRTGE